MYRRHVCSKCCTYIPECFVKSLKQPVKVKERGASRVWAKISPDHIDMVPTSIQLQTHRGLRCTAWYGDRAQTFGNAAANLKVFVYIVGFHLLKPCPLPVTAKNRRQNGGTRYGFGCGWGWGAGCVEGPQKKVMMKRCTMKRFVRRIENISNISARGGNLDCCQGLDCRCLFGRCVALGNLLSVSCSSWLDVLIKT